MRLARLDRQGRLSCRACHRKSLLYQLYGMGLKFIYGQRSGTGHNKCCKTGEVQKVTLVAWAGAELRSGWSHAN
jgi:hypothetical protein